HGRHDRLEQHELHKGPQPEEAHRAPEQLVGDGQDRVGRFLGHLFGGQQQGGQHHRGLLEIQRSVERSVTWSRTDAPAGSDDRDRATDQTNLRRMKTTKPMRARASVKAMPRNMVVRTMPAASGWRAMAWTDWPTRTPMPMPGPMAARP